MYALNLKYREVDIREKDRKTAREKKERKKEMDQEGES
jgi:hypothetical protein